MPAVFVWKRARGLVSRSLDVYVGYCSRLLFVSLGIALVVVIVSLLVSLCAHMSFWFLYLYIFYLLPFIRAHRCAPLCFGIGELSCFFRFWLLALLLVAYE